MQKIHKQKGFTLIELLVVIAMIGILSAIVLTALGAVRVAAKDASYIAYVSQLTKLVNIAYSDGAFDSLANERGCLGIYPEEKCGNNDASWEIEPMNINGVLSGYGELPDGQYPQGSDNYGTLIQRYTDSTYNLIIIFAYVGRDSAGNGRSELCDQFGWKSLDYVASSGDVCGTYIRL